MRVIHRSVSSALVLLGIMHTVMTVRYYDALSPAAVWFAGGGLALAFLGLLNLTAAGTAGRTARISCVLANLLGIAYGIVVAVAVPVPQAMIAVILLGSVAVTLPTTHSIDSRALQGKAAP